LQKAQAIRADPAQQDHACTTANSGFSSNASMNLSPLRYRMGRVIP